MAANIVCLLPLALYGTAILNLKCFQGAHQLSVLLSGRLLQQIHLWDGGGGPSIFTRFLLMLSKDTTWSHSLIIYRD